MIHGKTLNGVEFTAITPEEWKELKPVLEAGIPETWMPYDSSLIEIHIANCGYGILDKEYGTAIDDEYYLDEIYSMVENK